MAARTKKRRRKKKLQEPCDHQDGLLEAARVITLVFGDNNNRVKGQIRLLHGCSAARRVCGVPCVPCFAVFSKLRQAGTFFFFSALVSFGLDK